MNRLKDIWGGQDDMNRVLFLIAVAVFAWSLIEGHGMYGALMAGVVLFLMVSRHGQRLKRFSRLYGTLYFPMPDGELVPRTFEQVKTEYLHGSQGRYAGRAVELRFPWWYLNSAGEIDTGFGLTVRLADQRGAAGRGEAPAPGRLCPPDRHSGGREQKLLLRRRSGDAGTHLRKRSVPTQKEINAKTTQRRVSL